MCMIVQEPHFYSGLKDVNNVYLYCKRLRTQVLKIKLKFFILIQYKSCVVSLGVTLRMTVKEFKFKCNKRIISKTKTKVGRLINQ